AALLGDPQTVVLDEPVNGLDPEGIKWVRELLQNLALAGRTVFISSHLMSEMALTATRLIVIGRGRLIADTTVKEFIARASGRTVLVRTPDEAALTDLLSSRGARVHRLEAGRLRVEGLSNEEIGDVAWRHNLRVHELSVQEASLEEAFMELTANAVQYQAS